MTDSWVNSAERIGADLHLELSGPGGRRAALTRALREAVRSGRLAPDTRLPPYRSLAADLGVARNTVADAYAELVAEGWLTARQGSGTRVAAGVTPPPGGRRRDAPVPVPEKAASSRARGPRHDLRQGTPDVSSFPRAAWLASYRRALQQASNEAFGPGDPAGRIELREALAEYLARARGVRAEPGRIVICSGFAHALRLLLPRSCGARWPSSRTASASTVSCWPPLPCGPSRCRWTRTARRWARWAGSGRCCSRPRTSSRRADRCTPSAARR